RMGSSLNRSATAIGDAATHSHLRRYRSPIARRWSASVTTMKLQFCALDDVGACSAMSMHSRISSTDTGRVRSSRLRTDRVVVSSVSIDISTTGNELMAWADLLADRGAENRDSWSPGVDVDDVVRRNTGRWFETCLRCSRPW